MNTITIISVNVATPSVLGFADGEAVVSAIGKRPVGVASLSLSQLNLEGDEQADLRVHGGPDKAVYAYPSEHLGPWSEEIGVELHPGAFGENLSLAGVVEDEVFIGDTWRWGNARLQVSQPRSPCFKLAMRLQRPEIIKRMIAGERTGWYLRVLRPGRVPVRGPIESLGRDPLRLSVATAQRAAFGRERDSDVLERLVRHPALSAEWRTRVLGPFARARRSSGRRDLGPVAQERIGDVYGSAKLERLAALKTRWDPDNVFHLNANIASVPAGEP